MKLKNIVVATEKKGYYDVLEQSCKRHNIELISLGLGQKWTGFTMKFKLWHEYLKTLNEDEIVMINDAYDVIILENSDVIINKFKSFGKNVVFGIQDTLSTRLIFPKCKIFEKIMCVGNIIGYVKYLKELVELLLFKYKRLWEKYNNDDQVVLQHICNLQTDFFEKNVGIDTDRKLFFATGSEDYIHNLIFKGISGLYMKNNKLYTKHNITPSVLHLASDVDGEKYLNYLNYENIPIKKPLFTPIYKCNQAISMLKLIFYNNRYAIIISVMSIVAYLIFIKSNIINLLIFAFGYFCIFGEKGLAIFLILMFCLCILILKITSLIKK